VEKTTWEKWIPTGLSVPAYDPISFAQMKAETWNTTQGNLTGHNCPKCLNRGNIAIAREDGSITIAECDCMQIRKCIWEMERSGLGDRINKFRFEKYEVTKSWQRTLKDVIQAYANNPAGWLLVCGQSGSGKTHLCTAAARQRLLSGDVVRYCAWREAIAKLKALSMEADRRAEILDGFKKSPVLYIDDLFQNGGARPTTADVAIAFELIDSRYTARLPTIITTEKTPSELVQIDQAVGGRIIEMAGNNILEITPDPEKNYRLRNITRL